MSLIRLRTDQNKQVYLAGAIFGHDDRGQSWREIAIRALLPILDWNPLNPNTVEVDKVTLHDLVAGDYAAILGCQAMIAFVGEKSWGTAMEIAFAHQHGVPVIAWPDVRPCSLWLQYHVTTFSQTLQDAIGELKHVGIDHTRLVDSHR